MPHGVPKIVTILNKACVIIKTTGNTGNTGTERSVGVDPRSCYRGIAKSPVYPVSPVVPYFLRQSCSVLWLGCMSNRRALLGKLCDPLAQKHHSPLSGTVLNGGRPSPLLTGMVPKSFSRGACGPTRERT